MCLSKESHAEVGQEGFFCLAYEKSKQHNNEHNQGGANDIQSLIWIFWICQVSPAWYNIDHSQYLHLITINLSWSARSWSIIQQDTSSMKHRKPVLTCLISPSTFSIHCTNLFWHFSCIFTFLKIIKHNMPERLLFFFHLQYWNGYPKLHQIWCYFFLMHVDMTAVTI